MQRLQAFKFQLTPNGQQKRKMSRFSGACRFVFNKALALQKENHDAGNKFIGYVEMAKNLTTWRNGAETPWLKEAPVHPLQHTLKDLEKAYKNFFANRAAFPRFKKKGQGDSFRYPDPKQIKLDALNSRIFLPKLGWMRYKNSRQVLGEVRNATVIQSGGKWFVSIQTQREVDIPMPKGDMIGIDMGIAQFAILSNGQIIEPIHSFKKHQEALRKAQQALSRKVRFSKNWLKAKKRVQKLHHHIANVRKNFLHQTSSNISKNHAIVCIEDLKVKNMSKSAAGTTEQHGKKVRAKSGLNRSILDQGWYEFRRQLDYKLAWKGGHLIAVPPQNTSRTCPVCASVSKENRKTQAQFLCIECGYENNADIVGAINVLKRGEAILAAA